MHKVLLIEDEEDIRDLIEIQLKMQGYTVTSVADGLLAIDVIQHEQFDLYIIDRMLPGVPGLEICRFIRNYKETKKLPILIVTALAQSENVIEGLDAGADDYITKPFEMEILLARVRSLLRRSKISSGNQHISDVMISCQRVTVDTAQYKVWLDDIELVLTKSEYNIIVILLQNAGKVLTRKELVKSIQGENIHVTERTIDTHIVGIRKKLGTASSMIETIRGIGYRINNEK